MPHALSIENRRAIRRRQSVAGHRSLGANAKAFALSVCAVVSADTAFAVAEPYLGEVITLGTNFCPTGFLPMNGQLLSIGDYEDLFTLIGTRYGGNNQTTFALPAMPPTKTATGEPVLFCIAAFGIYPSTD
jgi:hypothetical protein